MIAERVERLAVHQDVELHEVVGAVADELVVHRRVAARDALQLVVEVEEHLAERHLVGDDDAVGRRVLDRLLRAAALLAEREHAPTYSAGTWIVSLTIGSSMRSM